MPPMAAEEKSSVATWFQGTRPVWRLTCPSQREVPPQTWSPFPAGQSAARPAPVCRGAARAAPAASAQGSGSAPRAPAGAAPLGWLSQIWPSMGPAGIVKFYNSTRWQSMRPAGTMRYQKNTKMAFHGARRHNASQNKNLRAILCT